MMYGDDWGWMWLAGLLMMTAMVVLVVWAVRALARGSWRSGPSGDAGAPVRGGRALELLDERYARGELSTEEYRERRQALDREG